MEGSPGKLVKNKDGFQVEFVRFLDHHIHKVWAAFSNPDLLKIWFTDFEMKLIIGADIKIMFRDQTKTVANGRVIKLNPPYEFVWSWEKELAIWKLEEQSGNKCKLNFIFSKMEDSNTISSTAGFHSLILRLENFLNGDSSTYPFGTEEYDSEQMVLREEYGLIVFDQFPELEAYYPIQIERVFRTSSEDLWKALTDNKELKKWYFDFEGKFKPEIGHTIEWYAGPPDGKKWLHRSEILDVNEKYILKHSWEYPGYSGLGELTWTIIELNPKDTKLILYFSLVQPFDHKQNELRRKNFVEGWNHIMNISLKTYLEGM